MTWTTLASRRLLLQASVVILFATLALLQPSPASAASASKSCTLTGSNQYTCSFVITPAIATGAGSWLVQMVSPGSGTFASQPTVVSATGCGPVSITAGTFISSPAGNADYDVTVGGSGCLATATVTVTETVTVSATGQVCQNVWITAGSPFVQSCASVTYTPPTAPPPPAATKTCSPASMPNQYTCIYTVIPGFPAVAGDLIHVNEAPIPVVPNPGYFLVGTPTVGTVLGCGQTPSPVVVTSSYGFNAQIGSGGCAGYTWSVQFIETIEVTATGQICQAFYMVAAVPPTTACANVTYTPPVAAGTPSAMKTCTLTSTPNVYTCLYTVVPAFPAVAGDVIHVNEPPGPPMTGPGTIISTPVVSVVSGCNEVPTPVVSSSSTSYHATIGPSGCPGVTWSVTFTETIAVTATGSVCQSFYMVAAVPPVTVCASVTYTPPGSGPAATKVCVPTTTKNVFTCTFTITPMVATAPGPWLVQMVTPGPGTFTAPSVVSNATTGCSTLPVVVPGTLISIPQGTADYNINIGAGGCTSAASIVITETVTVTATGQICQTVWITVASPGVTVCGDVFHTKSLTFPIGSIAPTGVSLTSFSGTVAELNAAGAANMPVLITVSATANGKLVTLVIGAPPFVNAEFNATFPNGLNATLMIVKAG